MAPLAPASTKVQPTTGVNDLDNLSSSLDGSLHTAPAGAPADALVVGATDQGLAAGADSGGPSDALGTQGALYHLAGASAGVGLAATPPQAADVGSSGTAAAGADTS